MGRFIGPEKVEAWFVDSFTDYTAPTTTELNGGDDLTGFIVDGGLDVPQSGRTVDAADLSSAFDSVIAGTRGGDMLTMTFHKDDTPANDTPFTTLPPGTTGYLCVAMYPLATAGTWATSDHVAVFPIEVITRNPANLAARNATQQYTVEAAITGPPVDDYTIAA